MDSDYGTAPADNATAYLTMLGIDCLLNTVTALEKLTDVAIEGATSPDSAAGSILVTVSNNHVGTACQSQQVCVEQMSSSDGD